MKTKKRLLIPEDGADEYIARLPYAIADSYTVRDSVSKLCVEVYKNTKTFRMRNTVHPNRPWIRIANADEMTCDEAREYVRSLRKKMREGKNPVLDHDQFKKVPTLMAAFEMAMAELVRNKINKKKTVAVKRSALSVCGERFYDRSLTDFTGRELIAKATWFRNKYSKSFYDNFYNAVFDAFDYAIRHNYPIERNVALDIKSVKTRKKDVPSARRDVEIEEIVQFNEGWLLHPACPLRLDHRRMLQLSQYTGLRVGSVRLIEWTDFDWLNGWLIIPVEKQKHRIEMAENYQAIYIAITDVLLDIIGGKPDEAPASKWLFPSFMKIRNGEAFEKPSNPPTAVLNHAFRVREGDIQGIDPYQVTRHQRVLIPEGVRKFVPHEYGRHTFATIAARAGIPPRIISIMMGHAFSHAQLEKDKDAAAPTTVKTYIHSKRAEELREWWFVWAKHYCEMLGKSVPDSVSGEVAHSKAYLQDQILSELSHACGGDLNLALRQVVALRNQGKLTSIRLVNALR